MDGNENHHTKPNKPDSERGTLSVFSHMHKLDLKKKNGHKQKWGTICWGETSGMWERDKRGQGSTEYDQSALCTCMKRSQCKPIEKL
jgi:hypothetical protein